MNVLTLEGLQFFYSKLKDLIVNIQINNNNGTPYDGKTIVMFGDSIVAGWGWQEGYGISKPLEEKYPLATWINKAISGSNMAEKSGAQHNSILSQVKNYMGTADYILLEGGTNDVNHNIPVGSMTSTYDSSYNENSFCGALESALQTIMNKWPLARKFFLIPHSFAKDNSYVDNIHNTAIEICHKWNVPVLDMREMSQIAMTNSNKATYTRNPNTNQGDGVHPTEVWYRALYSPVVDQFMRSLGEYAVSSEIPENVPVTGVTINKESISFTYAGQTEKLIATVSPSNATNKNVLWESDHPLIAEVDESGNVTAKSNGSAIITVKTVDGNKTDTCNVNVQIEEGQPEHTELSRLVIDKNCYFDTGVIPTYNTKFELKVKVLNDGVNARWVAGVRDTTSKYTLSITDNWYATRGTVSSAAVSSVFWETDWTISQDGSQFTFNGSPVSCEDIMVLILTYSFYVGNVNNGGSPYTGQGFDGVIYYLKMYEGDELIKDIVPVKKKDGTLCLYDKISKQYIYNKGTGVLEE